MLVAFKTAAKSATLTNAEFISSLKKAFGSAGKSEAEFNIALAEQPSRQAIVDVLKQEMPDFGLYLEAVLASVADAVVITAKAPEGATDEIGLINQYQPFIAAVKAAAGEIDEPVNNIAVSNVAAERVVGEIGRRTIKRKHFTKSSNNAEISRIIVKLISLSTLQGERFSVRKTVNGQLSGSQQQVSMAVMLPDNTPQSYLVNEAFVSNLIDRKIIAVNQAGEILTENVYLAVNVRGNVAMKTTYVETDVAFISLVEKDKELAQYVQKVQGNKRVILFHDTTTATFAGIIAALDREDFEKEASLENQRKVGNVTAENKATEIRLTKEAEIESKFAFMAKVKQYAKDNGNMPLADAAAELRLFEGLF